MRLELNREWVVGEPIGEPGGFGAVYAAHDADGLPAAVKLVPKRPGAERELLFTELDGVRNVVPTLDNGEHEDQWVLVMPRAQKSLRAHLQQQGALPLAEAVRVLTDIAETLTDLDGRVVHRDLKPENESLSSNPSVPHRSPPAAAAPVLWADDWGSRTGSQVQEVAGVGVAWRAVLTAETNRINTSAGMRTTSGITPRRSPPRRAPVIEPAARTKVKLRPTAGRSRLGGMERGVDEPEPGCRGRGHHGSQRPGQGHRHGRATRPPR
ncbi:protein kinase domain-containing protein [Streptomyces sp. CBMA152]|uniref:protein kinase domain-containing protein n=1 Tax=Streptomyces sp. CBMA152 TaxID=1896312 RepID=UPI001CB73746